MVIFHSYLSLPEGNSCPKDSDCWGDTFPPVSRLCAVGRLPADPRRGMALVEELCGLLGAAAQDGELRGTGEVGFVFVDDGLKVGQLGFFFRSDLH